MAFFASRRRVVPDVADALRFAAAPTFALMAVLNAMARDGRSDLICSTMPAGAPLGSMTVMYLLMSAFHMVPWLKRMRWNVLRARSNKAR
ncbi:hypothetical protein SSBR45G_33850 [Bradyrhizobium sp. SSBR45G]|uniref:hypothetical protein n=1 Tax=unclassified Bradyrhizobium TaxID=2631580 RepID=UPI0023428D82|nr:MULTISPECIES: hypothetical protein [unclassified Bradyrhizobium]GLH78476.1 hypothetical protein SSBR45G_33850 [Bradyrhizobium sp. SSBR45G]GLH86259.1 hypothetical protein SSBR45R_37190 [Bradyrhizobium sp. SSBR45R]